MEYIPLRIGATGPAVRYLQRRLLQLGYPVGKADGKFGAKTLRGVLAFQSAHELPVDGVVATNTWTALERHGGQLETAEKTEPMPLPLPEAPEATSPPPPPTTQAAPPEQQSRPAAPVPTVPLVEWQPMPPPETVRVWNPAPARTEAEPVPPWVVNHTHQAPPVPGAQASSAGKWTPVKREVTAPEMVAAVEAIASVTADTGPPQNPWQKMA